MKKLGLLLIVCAVVESTFSQNKVFKGRILLKDSFSVNDGVVVFPLNSDTVFIGKSGVVDIDLSKIENRVFFFQWMDLKSKVFRFSTANVQTKIFDVDVPDQKFYINYQTQYLCPICSSSKAIVPIIYGFPSEKDFHDAEEGKIKLGGCDIYTHQPKFHCKGDNFSF